MRITKVSTFRHRSQISATFSIQKSGRRFADKKVKADSASIRIPFQTGGEGYRQFWKMIFFLSSYKHLVDTGNFASNYKVSSGADITDYLNTNDDYEQLARDLQSLDIKSSSDLNSITTLKLLREIKTKLEGFISTSASEKEVQAWIDEDEHSHRQRRCLMFGLEYINFNREGSASSKKFDILTRIGNKNIEHVLIELKSPSEDIFKLKTTETINSPTIEYSLHEDVSRSVPQILEYKRLLESKPAGDPDLEKAGIKTTVHIKKCIIIIGKNRDDPRWIQNKNSVLDSLNSSLEIWTYTDLLNKLDSTIANLEAAAA